MNDNIERGEFVSIKKLIERVAYPSVSINGKYVNMYDSIGWEDSILNEPSDYLYLVVDICGGNPRGVIMKILERDTLKDTNYFIKCHHGFVEKDKKRNRNIRIDYLLDI